SFGPNGALILGDGKGAQIVAIDTGDTKPTKWDKTDIANLKDELAGRLGSKGDALDIIKMAVNPASHTAYIAVRKLDDKKDLILTINGSGKIGEFDLENVKYVSVSLPAGDNGSVGNVTDVAWAGDRIIAAAKAGKQFQNKIYS